MTFWTSVGVIVDVILAAIILLFFLVRVFSPKISVPPGIPTYVNRGVYRVRQPKRGCR